MMLKFYFVTIVINEVGYEYNENRMERCFIVGISKQAETIGVHFE